MNISTLYTLSAATSQTSSTGSTSSSGTTSATSAANLSLFGPAAILSLNSGSSVSVGGYSIAALQTKSKSTFWQFNLSGVTAASNSSSLPTTTVSEEQQKAEDAQIQTALDYVDQEQYDQARDLMTKLLEKNSSNAAAVQVLGLAAQGEGDYKKAEQYFLKAHALNPTVGYDKDASNARILQGDDASVLAKAQAYLKSTSQRDDGTRLLIALTQRSPDNNLAHIALGDALLDEGDGNNGLMQYNAALQTANTNELATLETKLTDLVKAAPKAVFVRQLLGKVYLKQNRYDDALQTLKDGAALAEDATSFDSDLAKAYIGVGHERLDGGDVDGALSYFEQAKQLKPTNTEVKEALAEGYIVRAERESARRNVTGALDDYQQAAALLGEKAGEKDLRERAAQGAYTLALHVQRERVAAGTEIDDEVAAFQTAYDLQPDKSLYGRKLAEARTALGDQFKADGDLKEAAAAYQRAYDVDRTDANKVNAINGWIAYADYRLANLNYDDAIESYTKALSIDQTKTSTKVKLAAAYNTRGLDYVSLEKREEAAHDFKSALRLDPNNTEYQTNYNTYSPWDT